VYKLDYTGEKAYIYGNGQVIAQYNGNPFSANKYFYLHDRLGSVRELINQTGAVVVMYTYNPFGETIESNGRFANPFRFTGQWYDSEIGQYYLRARMYDPHLGRFTGRDPILGDFKEPITLHKYVYCRNDPLNLVDPKGLWAVNRWAGHPELTLRAMEQFGFSEDDISLAITGNMWTDMRKDHHPFGFDAAHFTPGDEQEALAHAYGAMEMAIWFEKQGIHDVAMLMLGTALHTIQDEYCHSDAGAGWWEHRWGRSDDEGFLADADNPWSNRRAYKKAYQTSINWVSVFQHAVNDSSSLSADLDRSGGIGDGFVWSDPKDSFYDVLGQLFGKTNRFSGVLP